MFTLLTCISTFTRTPSKSAPLQQAFLTKQLTTSRRSFPTRKQPNGTFTVPTIRLLETCLPLWTWQMWNASTKPTSIRVTKTQTLAFQHTHFTHQTWSLKSGNTTLPTTQSRSDTMVKLKKFLSVAGKLNVQFKSFTLGLINGKTSTTLKPAGFMTRTFKLISQSLLLNSWSFSSLL